VASLTPPTFFWTTLFEKLSTKSRHFKGSFRRHSMVFAFTSLRHETGNNNLGNMPFQIHGQIYPIQGPFFYLKRNNYTRYAQPYILAPQLPASFGANNNSDLD
ncbi:hypothetical protein EDC96DRAFT_427427, partial [Choanephora cucurbitarum]